MDNSLKIISWNITRRCNLRCSHCYLPAAFKSDDIPEANSSSELSTRESLIFIDQIAQVNEEVMLILSGGEPLLRSDIYELAEYATEKGMMVVLGTNGLLLDNETAVKLKQSGVSGVSISLDSVNAGIHDRMRFIEGAWQRAVEAIKICRNNGISVQVNTVITKGNYDKIPEIIQFAHSLEANVFSPFFLVCTGRGEQLTDITPEQYEQVLTQIVNSQKKYKGMMIRARCAPTFRRILYQNNPESSLLKLDAGKCMAGVSYCRITPEGSVTPCPYMEKIVGSVRDKSFNDIWKNSEEFRALREPSLKGKCKACEFSLLCGGCRARAYASHNDIMDEDPWCIYSPKGGPAIAPPVFSLATPTKDSAGIGRLLWDSEAAALLKKIPFFVRPMVRGAVERYAADNRYNEITPEVMTKARKNFSMDKMARH